HAVGWSHRHRGLPRRVRGACGFVLSHGVLARRANHHRGRGAWSHRGLEPRLGAFVRQWLADHRHPAPACPAERRPLCAHQRRVRDRRPKRPGHDAGHPESRELRVDDRVGAGRVAGVHRPLLRPPRAQGGVRPAARGRGAAAVLSRAALLAFSALFALGVLLSSAQTVNADTLDVAEYRARLVQIRALVSNSRTASTPDRDRMLAQAATLLRQTTSLSVRGATVTVDDGAVAEVLAGPDGANRALDV